MYLRQSTSATVMLGPFVDPTDAVTAKTALSPSVRLSKNGGAFAARNSASAIAHGENGYYTVPLDATDTGTVGRLLIAVTSAADHLPVWERAEVLPAATYDALVAGTGGSLANLDAAVSSRLSTAGYTAPPSAAAVADQVWDETASQHDTAGSMGEQMNNAGAAADPLLNTVPGSYASGTAGHALGRIGSGQINVVQAVGQNGDTTIVQGDDYNATDGTALDYTDSDDDWPTLTSATITFAVANGSTPFSKTGSVVTATGTGKKVRVELTAAETGAIIAGKYRFDIQATLSSGRKVTLVQGWLTVREDVAA